MAPTMAPHCVCPRTSEEAFVFLKREKPLPEVKPEKKNDEEKDVGNPAKPCVFFCGGAFVVVFWGGYNMDASYGDL